MADVQISSFSFEDADLAINPETLPGAFEKKEEENFFTEKPKDNTPKTDTEETETNNPEAPVVDPLGILSKTVKEEEETQEVPSTEETKVSKDTVDYKEIARYLIEQGIWAEPKDFETISLDDDTFKEFSEAQSQYKASLYLQEERSSFGEVANQFIDFAKAGGNLPDFLSNFNQSLDIDNVDIEEESGQTKIIKEYYFALGWEEKKIQKHIDRLKDSGVEDFKEEAQDCKVNLKKELDEQRAELVKEQELIQQDRKLQVETFNRNLRKVIHEDGELADRDKKELERFAFAVKQDANGNKVTELYEKFTEVQRDPKKYYKFLRVLKDFDKFEEKEKTEKKVLAKQYNFLRGSQSSLANVQSSDPKPETPKTKSPQGFRF